MSLSEIETSDLGPDPRFRCTRCRQQTATEQPSRPEVIRYRCENPECDHAWEVSREAAETLSAVVWRPDRDAPFDDTYGQSEARSADRRPLVTLAGLAAEPPRPLRREPLPGEPFPTEALGEILGPAAVAIAEKTQAPDAICGQSVLATSTLAVQGLADVNLPTGAVRPLSGYFLSVASSGERKTSADQIATAPVREREATLAAAYARDREAYERDLAAWEKQQQQELNKKNSTREEKRAALEDLGPRPHQPLVPFLTCPEPTFEGLTKLLDSGHPSQGLFSSEGGQFIGGHGMNLDNRLKTAAALSGLWDGEPVKRVRASDSFSMLRGRRLVVHLLAQPGVAAKLLSDPLLADQGLLSRLLVAAPESTVGRRFWREISDETEANLGRYLQRLSAILSTPLSLAEGTRNELRPRTVSLLPLARGLWIEFADHVERHMGPGGDYESIRSFANKLPEHAARLAGVVALIHDPDLQELSEDDLARGIELAKFYANEALRLFEAGALDPDLALAQRLLDWLQKSWTEEIVSLPDIYQRGPKPIRDQKSARSMVQLLEQHGWLEPIPEGAEVAGTKRREVWRILKP